MYSFNSRSCRFKKSCVYVAFFNIADFAIWPSIVEFPLTYKNTQTLIFFFFGVSFCSITISSTDWSAFKESDEFGAPFVRDVLSKFLFLDFFFLFFFTSVTGRFGGDNEPFSTKKSSHHIPILKRPQTYGEISHWISRLPHSDKSTKSIFVKFRFSLRATKSCFEFYWANWEICVAFSKNLNF